MALTAIEAEFAAAIPVWVVWWEDPERSWEAICLSQAEAEKEYESRQADHLLKSWGKVGRSGQQSLLQWLEGHLGAAAPGGGADEFVNPAKEVLRRISAGETGSVILRTW